MEGYGPTALTGTTSTGVVTQIYPNWIRYIDDKGTNTQVGHALPVPAGGLLRRPVGGRIGQVSVETDATDGGIMQLFDISGLDTLDDVSSGTTITNASLVASLANGRAKLIWEQNFAASPGAPIIWNWTQGFLRGLAARFVGSGTCSLNVIGEGGFQFLIVAGAYAGG